MTEVERIIKVYQKRKLSGLDSRYSYFCPDSLFKIQQREKQILTFLRQLNWQALADWKILDLGCFGGDILGNFLNYGASPQNCFGIDLLPDRIASACRRYPEMSFHCGNAENLPYEAEAFDLIICFTVFSSILDQTMKGNISQEMLRVLKPGGNILWYDFFMNNPKNPDVLGIKQKEIYELYRGCDIQLKRITLAPPIARALAPHSFLVCQVLEMLKILNTHYLGLIHKKAAG